jgi:hypothetical protein
MKYWLALCMIVSICCANAQNVRDTIATCDGGEIEFLPFVKDRYYFPASQKITIFSRPDARSKVFYQTTSFSDTLRFIEVMKDYPSKFKNIYGYWCKIAFPFKGKRYVGFVPSQFLSRTHIRENNLIYLVNLELFTHDTFVCSLKILTNMQLTYEYKFSPVANYSNPRFERDTLAKDYSGYFGTVLCTNQGLKNVDRILYVYSGYPACGYWNGSKILMLKNNKVTCMLEDGNVVDGGEFAASSEFLFPTDSLGKQDSIVQKWSRYEVITDTTEQSEASTITYYWTGNSLLKTDSTYSVRYNKPYMTTEETTKDTAR